MPNIESSSESFNPRRPRVVSSEGDLSSSSSDELQELGVDANDAEENKRLKREMEITRRLLLIKNSNPNGN